MSKSFAKIPMVVLLAAVMASACFDGAADGRARGTRIPS